MNKKKIILLSLSFLLFILFILFTGAVKIDLSNIFTNSKDNIILWKIRVPRLLLGFLTGSILSLSGFIFQNLFKNELATPFTLGVSSGAAAGAVISIKFNIAFTVFGLTSIQFFGFVGAILTIGFIILVAGMLKNFSIYTLLMTGIAINFFSSSIILFSQYIFDYSQTISVLRWLMGSLETFGYKDVLMVFPFFIILIIIVFLFKREILFLSANDEFASSKGIDVERIRTIMFVFVSLIIGVVVSITGPIGFIGLIIPHISRLLFRLRLNSMILFNLFAGGVFLITADFLSRVIINSVEIPVGIITSLFGAPFFLYILLKKSVKQ